METNEQREQRWKEEDQRYRERIAAIGDNPACHTCAFYAATHHGPDGARYLLMNDRADCRRHAPSADRFTFQNSGMAVPRWPGTQPWDWCGEYVKEPPAKTHTA